MKKAFTLLELVFVVVIIGILSTFINPSFGPDPLNQAANQIVSHIRYTQHLAMMDNKFDPTDRWWFRKRWRIYFDKNSDNTYGYTIYRASQYNKVFKTDVAKNPLNTNELLTGLKEQDIEDKDLSKNMIIGEAYGIGDVTLYGNCGGNQLMFDNVGRPYFLSKSTSIVNPTQSLITGTCNLRLKNEDGSKQIIIRIEKETGYAHIVS